MDSIKRAFYYLKEKIGKSILLFVIFLFISNLVLAGLAIQNASELSLKQTREQLGSTVTLSGAMQQPDMSSGGGASNVRGAATKVDVETAESLLASGYVASYDYTVQTTAVASNFDAYVDETTEEDTTTSDFGGMQMPEGESGRGGGMFNTTATNMIYGVLNLQYATDFQNGTATLTEGRYITADDKEEQVVVIEQQLAELNTLTVGDTINLKKDDDSTEVTYTIVGIFEVSSASTVTNGFGGMSGFSLMDTSNRIYMPYYEANVFSEADNNEEISSATYYLTDPNDIDAFKAYATDTLGLDTETYTLDANDTAYQRVASSIEQTVVFAKVMVIITIVAGSIILLLIIMLAVRERQYEIGVLLSLGESKLQIISQFIAELFILFAVAAVLTVGTGSFVSKQVATLITSTTSASEEQTGMGGGPTMNGGGMQGGGMVGGGNFPGANSTLNMTDEETELEVNPTVSDYGLMFLVGISIIIIATSIPALMVLQKKPKEILTKN